MADRDDPSQHSPRHEPVGTVAEETARLVEALGGWAQGLGVEQPRPGAAPPHRGNGASGEPNDGASREARDGASREARDGGSGEARNGGSGEPRAGTRPAGQCEHCGSPARAGEALACELCPSARASPCCGRCVLRPWSASPMSPPRSPGRSGTSPLSGAAGRARRSLHLVDSGCRTSTSTTRMTRGPTPRRPGPTRPTRIRAARRVQHRDGHDRTRHRRHQDRCRPGLGERSDPRRGAPRHPRAGPRPHRPRGGRSRARARRRHHGDRRRRRCGLCGLRQPHWLARALRAQPRVARRAAQAAPGGPRGLPRHHRQRRQRGGVGRVPLRRRPGGR